MEGRKTIIQTIKGTEEGDMAIAIRYYSVLAALNKIKLTEREIQLIAFLAIRGNVSYSTNREEFCKLYSSSSGTIYNMLSRLRKMGILIKSNSKVKVHPSIMLDFNNDLLLQIKLTHGH
jgi:hypothetical protein